LAEKTEKATPKKRNDQRKEGNTVISQDIVSAVVLICVFGMLQVYGPQYIATIGNTMKSFLGGTGGTINGISDMLHKFAIVAFTAAEVLAPIFIVNILVSVVATMAQTRLLISPAALKFKISKINPISGIKNLFSPKSLMEVLKSIIKMTVIIAIIYSEVKDKIPIFFTIYNAEVGTSLTWMSNLLLDICFKVSEAFLVIGVIDYFYQWWDYERRMKMSKEDVKEEAKQAEGNPETKGRIRNIQRQMARRRMMQAVPLADVVIRNPTHYAIALKYEREKANAPLVVAKGQNNVALKIVEVAMAANVHIVENKPLAQALYKTTEVGEEIPEEFYKAVAEVLAYIYKLKRAGRS
jgi:flagellar biosynthetic protein FlhB